MNLNLINFDYLFQLARTSIDHGLEHNASLFLNPRYIDPVYLEKSCTFVSLTKNNENVGCIGNTSILFLYHAILTNSFKAAFRDNRFPPINKNLIKKLHIQIHYLGTEFQTIKVANIDELANRITPEDSVSLYYENKNATMLADIQKNYSTKQEFISAIMEKAKIPKNVEFNKIKVNLYKTFATEKRKLQDIKPCQNYI